MTDRNRRTAAGLVLVLVAVSVVAGPAKAEWRQFTQLDGLNIGPSAMLEDSSGDIWIAGRAGVSRYDGATWTSSGVGIVLGADYDSGIIEDRAGNIWVGAARFDGTSWIRYTEEDGLLGLWVNAVVEDEAGNIWFGANEGLSRFDGENWTSYTDIFGVGKHLVRSAFRDSSGDLWFGGGGIARFDGLYWQNYNNALIEGAGGIKSILEDSSGNMWFVGEGAVISFDGSSWIRYEDFEGMGSSFMECLFEDSSGRLWIGGGGGAVCRDGDKWTKYSRENGLGVKWVQVITEDHLGNMWFGGSGALTLWDGVAWGSYKQSAGLLDNNVIAIARDSSGDMWVGTGQGLSRFNGETWTTYTEEDGLGQESVSVIAEGNDGEMWFGHSGVYHGVGLSRFDGSAWTTYTELGDLSLIYDFWGGVGAIYRDSSGNIWVGTWMGVAWFDGTTWETITTELYATEGLIGGNVTAILEDRNGDMWFGVYGDDYWYMNGGVCRYDGENWIRFTKENGLPDNTVYDMIEDSSGDIWVATEAGVSRYDGEEWLTYHKNDDLINGRVSELFEDSMGSLWAGGYGLNRFNGESWVSYRYGEGLLDDEVMAITQDRSGRLWFGTPLGVSVYTADYIPPKTVISPMPPSLTASRSQTVAFTAAYKDLQEVRYSYSFDGEPWSAWSAINFWVVQNLTEGPHEFQVRARDRTGNVGSPAVYAFEVDATPPSPLISSPAFGQAVRDSIVIAGTADDLRFKSYRVEVRKSSLAPWDLLRESIVSVNDGILAGWNTSGLGDGEYELRLSVSDTLEVTGRYDVRVIVDNEAPWAYETAPAVIKYGEGGDVYTTNREAHLYFPPNGFVQDTEVRIDRLTESDVPDTLDGGATRALAGYEISWGDSALAKPATLELSYEGMEFDRDSGPGAYPDENTLAIYLKGADSKWLRLGGTVDTDGKTISTSLKEPGRYSVFAGGQIIGGGRALSALSITPRVFSPSGGFASSRAAIGFTLGRPAPVTVKIYNRAGRLVRELISGEQMTAGSNLVQWDGRDRERDLVEDGVYLVTVEALGKKQVKPLAVVR